MKGPILRDHCDRRLGELLLFPLSDGCGASSTRVAATPTPSTRRLKNCGRPVDVVGAGEPPTAQFHGRRLHAASAPPVVHGRRPHGEPAAVGGQRRGAAAAALSVGADELDGRASEPNPHKRRASVGARPSAPTSSTGGGCRSPTRTAGELRAAAAAQLERQPAELDAGRGGGRRDDDGKERRASVSGLIEGVKQLFSSVGRRFSLDAFADSEIVFDDEPLEPHDAATYVDADGESFRCGRRTAYGLVVQPGERDGCGGDVDVAAPRASPDGSFNAGAAASGVPAPAAAAAAAPPPLRPPLPPPTAPPGRCRRSRFLRGATDLVTRRVVTVDGRLPPHIVGLLRARKGRRRAALRRAGGGGGWRRRGGGGGGVIVGVGGKPNQIVLSHASTRAIRRCGC